MNDQNSIIKSRLVYGVVILMILFVQSARSQVFVQLEFYDDPKSVKFGSGSTFVYKSVSSPDYWQKDKIESIDYENQLIIFNRGYEYVADITHLKVEKQFANQLGNRLMQFSVGWFLYGGIASLINQDAWDFGWDTVGIGAGAFASGFAIKKIGGTKTYNLRRKNRLRIIDVSWPQPTGGR